ILPKTNVASAEKLLKNGGLLISEYYDNNFSKSRYIQRNRIISGLGSAVLLPEFKARSGTIHTARFAWLQNKKIFCFNNDSSGVQKVLASGNAFIFNSTEDLIKRIGE
ncbi:DNA-processing protein DprA, partial [Limosilactobacillus reuteri]